MPKIIYRRYRQLSASFGGAFSMANPDDRSLLRHSPDVVASRGVSIQDFERVLLERMEQSGLPSDGVLVDVSERERMLANVGASLERLDTKQRGKSMYISKMIAAVFAGLFDAALNYLWDETITDMRRRVVGYDLAYFFELAVPNEEKRKGLHSEEHLQRVEDADLMRAANRMGLISDVGFAQLDHIRYMRNYASAAHPNQASITGLQLATWLETCVREVITLPLDTVAAEIRKLLHNVRTARLDDSQLAAAASFFNNLSQGQADDLAVGLFGIYVNPGSSSDAQGNVLRLWPDLWPYVSEDARYGIGTKYSRFQANADHRQTGARQLIDLVDGSSYLPESTRAVEIANVIDDLLSAHQGINNFYNEPSFAERLSELVGKRTNVPRAVVKKYVNSLVYVFLTNGYGVAWGADPIYRDLIERFSVDQAATALRAFDVPEIANKLQLQLGREKWQELLDLLEPKLTARPDRELLSAIRQFGGSPDQLRKDSNIRQVLDARRRTVRRRSRPHP